jgi:outer membrane scaffolding protein for murein synthesis (MipA/OmpV family)
MLPMHNAPHTLLSLPTPPAPHAPDATQSTHTRRAGRARSWTAAGALAAGLAAVAPAAAQGPAVAGPGLAVDRPAARAAQPLWEAGLFAGAARQPAYPGARQTTDRSLVLPWLIYRGRVLRADDGSVGLRALKSERTEVDIGFAGSFGSRADDGSARAGMPRIGTLVEFGPRVVVDLGRLGAGQLQLRAPLRGVFDLDDSFAHRGMAFEPSLRWGLRRGSATLGLELGAIWGDRRLAATFYGVDAPFATPQRPVYAARAGLIATRASVSGGWQLDRDWRVFGFARLDSVAGAANERSPLVERQHGTTVGLGVSWTLGRSTRMGVD